jgi:hypothetical protein
VSTPLDALPSTRTMACTIRQTLDEILMKISLAPYSVEKRAGLRSLLTGAEQRRVGAHGEAALP